MDEIGLDDDVLTYLMSTNQRKRACQTTSICLIEIILIVIFDKSDDESDRKHLHNSDNRSEKSQKNFSDDDFEKSDACRAKV